MFYISIYQLLHWLSFLSILFSLISTPIFILFHNFLINTPVVDRLIKVLDDFFALVLCHFRCMFDGSDFYSLIRTLDQKESRCIDICCDKSVKAMQRSGARFAEQNMGQPGSQANL